jgi:hypothetical protein
MWLQTGLREPMDEDSILLELNQRWGCDLPFGWVPITNPAKFSEELEVYGAEAFAKQFDGKLPMLLEQTFGVSELYEITEGGTVKIVALADCLFRYSGLEHIYTDQSFRFLLYFSHESSVTAGGKTLVDLIHQIWPESIRYFWPDSL